MIDRWFQSVASSGQQENIGRPTCNSTMIAKAPRSRKGGFRFWWIQNEKHSSMSRVKSDSSDMLRQWQSIAPTMGEKVSHGFPFKVAFLESIGESFSLRPEPRTHLPSPAKLHQTQISAVSPCLVIVRAAACCCYLSTLCLCRHHLSTNLVTLEGERRRTEETGKLRCKTDSESCNLAHMEYRADRLGSWFVHTRCVACNPLVNQFNHVLIFRMSQGLLMGFDVKKSLNYTYYT